MQNKLIPQIKLFDFSTNFKYIPNSKHTTDLSCLLTTTIKINKIEIKSLVKRLSNINIKKVNTLNVYRQQTIRTHKYTKDNKSISGVNIVRRIKKFKKIILRFDSKDDLKQFVQCITNHKL